MGSRQDKQGYNCRWIPGLSLILGEFWSINYISELLQSWGKGPGLCMPSPVAGWLAATLGDVNSQHLQPSNWRWLQPSPTLWKMFSYSIKSFWQELSRVPMCPLHLTTSSLRGLLWFILCNILLWTLVFRFVCQFICYLLVLVYTKQQKKLLKLFLNKNQIVQSLYLKKETIQVLDEGSELLWKAGAQEG